MTAIVTATGVIRRVLVTPARIGISLLLGGLLSFAAIAANLSGEADDVVADVVPGGLLLLVVPLISLVFAVGALGDLVDDDTIVYLWLKPLPRWQLALGAVLATWLYVVPTVAVVAAVIAVAGGDPGLLVAAVVSCVLASMAYGTVFVGLGLRTTRSLLAGLAFVLIWEGFLAALSDGIATMSVRRWSSALFSDLGDVESVLEPASAVSSAVVLGIIVTLGLALTTRWLGTREIP